MKRISTKYTYLLVLLTSLFANFLFGQNRQLDSLQTIILHEKNDTIRVELLLKLARVTAESGYYGNSIKVNKTALQEAIHYHKIHPDQRIWFKKMHARYFFQMGSTIQYEGKYPTAYRYLISGLKIAETYHFDFITSYIYTNLGINADERNDFKLAENYFKKAVFYAKKSGNINSEAVAYLNFGSLYLDDYSQKNIQYEKGLTCYKRAISLFKKINHYKGLATCYGNLGTVYFDKQFNRGLPQQVVNKNLEIALSYLMQSSEYRKKIHDIDGEATTLLNMGCLFTIKKEYTKAYQLMKKAEELFHQIGLKDGYKDCYRDLADLFEKQRKFKEAYHYQKLFLLTNDSLINDRNNSQINELNIRYETEKKNKELIRKDALLKVKKTESAAQNFKVNVLIFGLSSITILLLLLFRNYKAKVKANTLLAQQKNEIENINVQLNEKQTEITESIHYAKTIQDALLARNAFFQEKFTNHFIYYQPKDIVSGDFYWAYQNSNGLLFWAVGDCTGHGVSGAFMTMIANALLNEIIIENNVESPADILQQLRTKVIHTLTRENDNNQLRNGLDLTLCVYDISKRQFSFAGANHSIFIYKSGVISEIYGNNQPIGIHPKQTPFDQKTIAIQPGDRIFCLTDGYYDQWSSKHDSRFKKQQFIQLLTDIQVATLDEQKRLIQQYLSDWKGSEELTDDVLILGVEI